MPDDNKELREAIESLTAEVRELREQGDERGVSAQERMRRGYDESERRHLEGLDDAA